MADNVEITAGAGTPVTTDQAADGSHMQLVKLAYSANADKTPIGADANGLDVDVTRLPALAAGTNNIGDVDVLTLPALPAGTNNIGDVDVLTLPAPFGAPGAASVAKAEDAVSADGDVGIPAMAVRKATPANTSGTDGDYEMLQMSAGRLWVSATVDAALPAGTNAIGKLAANSGIDIGDVDVTSLTGGTIAHDSPDSGNPIKVGARAASTLSDDTMVANADRVDLVGDLDAALIVRSGFPLGDLISEVVTNTNGTSTAFSNFSATANTRSFITAIAVYNSSATAGTVDFRDGTAGSVLWTMPIPAGGGAVIANGGTPLFKTSAATALAYDVSGALSTVTINVSGFKSKVV